MLFWLGFIVMVVNEGFVIMRHVHPWFARKREALMEKYGHKWKTTHGLLDALWILLVLLGISLDTANWPVYVTALGIFWGSVLVFVYLPKLIRKLLK